MSVRASDSSSVHPFIKLTLCNSENNANIGSALPVILINYTKFLSISSIERMQQKHSTQFILNVAKI